MVMVLLFLLLLPLTAEATPLSDAAAKLSPGQWGKVTMSNVNITGAYPAWDPGGNNGPGFDSWQPAWDSTARKLYIETAEHNISTFCPGSFPNYPHVCFKPMWTYDDATDHWDIGATGTSSVTVTGVYPNNSGSPVNTFHAWNLPAWDDVNKVFYIGGSYNFPIQAYRYCVNNTPSWCAGKQGVWTAFTGPTERSGNTPQAAVFHEGLNSSTGGTLLYYDGDGYGAGCGGLYGFRESTASWTVIREVDCSTGKGLPSISHNTLAFYSRIKQIAVFGGGSTFYKIDNVGTITQLDNPPCSMNTTNPGFAMPSDDPVSGDFYIIACKQPSQFIKLNPTASTGSQWTVIDSNLGQTGKICNVLRDTSAECALDVYSTPISTYGVIGYWKFLRGSPNSAEYWIYKASAGGPDITPPTVSVTAPSAGATVSGTSVTLTASASDNSGVVAGVQFKVDGSNISVEDTSSPYSITWDSTTVSNASHLITAVARDAAGNTTTSSAVSVTVSNAGGGADFATRCNGFGVIFCNGFDTTADLGGDGWGSARGRAPADSIHQFCSQASNICPTIDTTDKVSGAGSLKFTIPPGATGGAAGSYWANPAADFSMRFGANQTYYVQFRQKITASYFPAILVDNDKIHWVSTRPDLPGCNTSNTTNCFSSCTENELVNQNHYGVAADALPRWYTGCPGPESFEMIEPTSPGQWKLQNARTGLGCTYDNVNAGNRFPPKGNCFGYQPDQWVTYSYKIALGSLGTGPTGGLCYDPSNPGSIVPNLPSCYYGGQILMRMGLDGQPLEDVVNWTGPVIAKYMTDTTELKYGKVYFSPYTGIATIPSGAAMWFDELIISTAPIPDPGSGGTITPPSNVTLTRRRIQ